MAPITETLLIFFLLTLLENSFSLTLGRSLRAGKYRIRPVILFRQPQPDYADEDPFNLFQEPSVQESSYPEYEPDYYSGGKQPEYDPFAQFYKSYDSSNNFLGGANGKIQDFLGGLEQNAADYVRPISTVPPTTTLGTYETSVMPNPTAAVHLFNRGQKEFPMLRPPTETRRSVPEANSESYGVVKNFESTRIKPAGKGLADILSAELEHLKSRAH